MFAGKEMISVSVMQKVYSAGLGVESTAGAQLTTENLPVKTVQYYDTRAVLRSASYSRVFCPGPIFLLALVITSTSTTSTIVSILSASHNYCRLLYLLPVTLKVISANRVDPDQTAPLGAV